MATTSQNTPSIAERLGLDQAASRHFHLKWWLLGGSIALALAIGVVLWRRGGERASQYVTQPVERGDLTVTVSATGSLKPTNQVEVGSELSGIVRTVEVEVDARVKVGQVLARLDTTKLEAQAMQSKASLEAAQAQLQQRQATLQEARDQLARLEQVYQVSDRRVPSQQELDAQRAAAKRAEADLANAAAAVSQARAALETIQTDLSKMVIRSPIKGVVLTRSVDPGQTVAASFQAPVLFTIAEDLTKMKLTVNVDEADIGQVQRGQEATFTVDAYPDRVFEAQVAEVRFA
jgi:HlyD family secretion protein